MNSIAIWSDSNINLEFHLDLNLLITKKEDDNYIEFGFKLLNKNIENLYIYLPFKITNNDFSDKIDSLAKDSILVNAMFNKKLSVENLNSSFFKVTENGKLQFCFCKLSKEDVEIKEEDSGTQISIKINKTNTACDKLYYRFRINKLKDIFDKINTNWVFTNGVEEDINFIEININSVRKLPSRIVDNIQEVKIKSINVFVITENFANLLFYSKKIYKSRVLEELWKDYVNITNNSNINKLVAYHWKQKLEELWKDYVNTTNNSNINKLVAYHWKQESENFVDYNLFIKISYAFKNKSFLVKMFLFVLISSALGGVCGNYLTKLLFALTN